jgi:hypothetical protein
VPAPAHDALFSTVAERGPFPPSKGVRPWGTPGAVLNETNSVLVADPLGAT